MKDKKIAIIDLGTNTFHLMIAILENGQYRILSRERIAVKIGMGGINQGVITEEGLHRGIKAMKQFKLKIDQEDVSSVFAFGTSALRKAKNGAEVAGRLEAESGIPIEIISGEDEAAYIYRGVRAAVSMGQQTSMILDIGGGSVEFIIGNDQSIFWKHSFELGAQRLLERFQKHDPIQSDELDMLYQYISGELHPLINELVRYNPDVMIGSSGTFDTLSEMYCLAAGIPYSENFPETPLTIASFYESFEALKRKNRIQRLQMPGMIEMRVDMIVVACCIIDYLLRQHTFTSIRVSTHSLKEGVLASLK